MKRAGGGTVCLGIWDMSDRKVSDSGRDVVDLDAGEGRRYCGNSAGSGQPGIHGLAGILAGISGGRIAVAGEGEWVLGAKCNAKG